MYRGHYEGAETMMVLSYERCSLLKMLRLIKETLRLRYRIGSCTHNNQD
jgi:hypothetical protein